MMNTLTRLILSLSAVLPLAMAGVSAGFGPESAAAADPGVDPLREALTRGLLAEEVDRDPAAAAREYEAVLAAFADQRAVAASARFRLAEIHRKAERKDEAVAAYQRLLREFPEAGREADLARQQLAAWDIAPAAPLYDADADPQDLAIERLARLSRERPDVFRESHAEVDVAIKNGWDRVLSFLLDEGMDIDRAMEDAIDYGSLDMLEVILERVAESDVETIYRAIRLLAKFDFEHPEILDVLLARMPDVNFHPDMSDGAAEPHNPPDYNIPLLFFGLLHSDIAITQTLVEAGADINIRCRNTGETPLHFAASHGNAAGVSFLLELGVEVETTPLQEGDDEAPSQELPRPGTSVLENAIRGGNPEVVELLLEHGADPNLPLAAPPLLLAFQNIPAEVTSNERGRRHRHQVALIRLLLEHGADPNARPSRFSRRPLPEPNRRPILGQTDYGRSLFVENPREPENIASGWFHEVIRLYHDHAILNLELVKILLDAGAVPGEEFPEIFIFVATGGSSERRAAVTSLAGVDVDLQEIAKALLKHRPEKIHFENLKSVSGWEPGVRRLFLDEVVFPHLHEQGGGVSLCHFVNAGDIQTLVEAGQPVPDTATLLHQNLEKLTYHQLILVRRNPDGTWLRQPIDWQGDGPLPELKAGDIVEMEPTSEELAEGLLRWALQRRRPAFQITVALDGTEREITVRPDLLAFDPASSEVPMLHAAALARLLGQGLSPEGIVDPFDSGTSTLRRAGWPDLSLSASTSTLVPLKAGDHLTLVRDRDLGRRPGRRGAVALTVPGVPFLRQFEGSTPPTLVQAIADAWSPWQDFRLGDLRREQSHEAFALRALGMENENGEEWASVVPRDPDFSRIRIRRLAEDGSETVLSVDLENAILASSEETSPTEARLADVELQPGDIVEIPLRDAQTGVDWQGFAPETLRFFDKALSARFVVIISNRGVEQREFDYQPPSWIDGPHGLIALPPATGCPTARFTAMGNGSVQVVVEALRGGQALPLADTAGWFVREGDQVSLSLARRRVPQPPPGQEPQPPTPMPQR